MAIQIEDTIYIIKNNPINRQQKRIAQKELEKIQYYCLPIISAYLDSEDKTDSLRLFAKEQYFKNALIANKGNIYVFADLDFFNSHYPTKSQINKKIKPNKKAVYSALLLFFIVFSVIVLSILLA